MTLNNNFSVIPFYGSLAERESAKPWAYGEVYPLVVSTDSFLPFFVWLNGTENTELDSVLIKDIAGATIGDLTSAVDFLVDDNINKTCVYLNSVSGLNLPEGRAYVEVSYTEDGESKKMYSDIVTCVSDLSCYLKLIWFNESNIYYEGGYIPYMEGNASTDFMNVLYVNSAIGKPEYKFNEEGEERDGYFFASKQTSEKTYKFIFCAPESLCDAMRCIRMSDFVKITDQVGREYICDTFLMNVSWLQDGYFASIDVEFETDTIVKVIGKGLGQPITGDFSLDKYSVDVSSEGVEQLPINIIGTTRGGLVVSTDVAWITPIVFSAEQVVELNIGESDGHQRVGKVTISNGLGCTKEVVVTQLASALMDFRDSTATTPPVDLQGGRVDVSSTIFEFYDRTDEPIEVRFEGFYDGSATSDFIGVYNQGGSAIDFMEMDKIEYYWGKLKQIILVNWQAETTQGWSVNIGTFNPSAGIWFAPDNYDGEDISIMSDGAEGYFDGIKFEVKI